MSLPRALDALQPAAVVLVGLLVLLVCAPFEAITPLVKLPGQSLSTLEPILLLVFGAWAAAIAWSRRVPVWQTPLTAPAATALCALTMAAVAAPLERANAVHMALRLWLTFGLGLAAVNAATTRNRARLLMLAAFVSGTIAAILVLIDFSGLRLGQMVLSPFRTQTANVGSQVRASGSFQYPTIASMFLEVTFAFGVAWLPVAAAGRRSAVVALLAGLLLTAGAITLTYTRAGLITMAVTLVIVAALHLRRSGWDRSLALIAGLAAAVAVMVAASRPVEATRLRLTTEGQENWYRASIDAPAQLPIGVGERIAVPLTLTNSGQVTWDSFAPRPFGVSYHWLLADADSVVSWEGLRASFPRPVPAGESVTVTVVLEAPRQPGEYRVVWDLYQEDLLWFSTEPGAELSVSRATVRGTASGAPLSVDRLSPMPKASVRPRRLLLWRAAGRMLAERPWLGVGPDNFRLRYGPYAGLARPDPRVHTNNMYVELIVGGGLLAAGALAWLMWRVVAMSRWLMRGRGDAVGGALSAGVLAATAAIAIHGLVDSFLSFTATYSLIGISLGLLAACGRLPDAHAHRI